MPQSPAHALSALLDRSFLLWWRSLAYTAPLALIGALPGLLNPIRLPSLESLHQDPEAGALAFIEPLTHSATWWTLAAAALFALWLHSAQAICIDAVGLGDKARPLHALMRALLGLPRLLGTVLACVVLGAVALMPLLIWSGWLGLQALPLPLLLALSMLGSALWAVPLCWLTIVLMFAPYASALDRANPLAALAGSRARVRGQWWRLMVFVSIPSTLYLGAASVLALAPATLQASALQIGWKLDPHLVDGLVQAAGLLVAALGGPMMHACLISAWRESVAPDR